MIGDGEISLYFHIPFCSKKCPYCHFFVLPDDARLKEPFVDALVKEWHLRLPQLEGIAKLPAPEKSMILSQFVGVAGRPELRRQMAQKGDFAGAESFAIPSKGKRVVSIYFGGGTPTKLAPAHYHRILSQIEKTQDCEVTLEANPEDVTLALMQEYRDAGINRVSLGVQSFVDQDLIVLGRTHDASRAVQAIHATYEAKIFNISADLMFELPTQTLEGWEKTLKTLSGLPLTHLSLYNLTFEPHTVFFKQRKQLLPKLPPEEIRLQMLQMAVQSLESIGLTRYEISAFAKRGMHSRHNSGYWTGRPFLGFGPSAFSYWDAVRFSNVSNLNKYLASLEQNRFPVDFEEKLAYPRNVQELFAIHLRLVDGVDVERFAANHGPLPQVLQSALQRVKQKGWVEEERGKIKLTGSGQLFYDSVATELI
jgi:oxygen-independent coproporphyrinogen-3 oxidase